MDTRLTAELNNNISLFKKILAKANALLKDKQTQTEENLILDVLTRLKSRLIQMMGEGDSIQMKEMANLMEEAQGLIDSLRFNPSEKKNELSSNSFAYFNNTVTSVSDSAQSAFPRALPSSPRSSK